MEEYDYYETLTTTGQDAENDVNLILNVFKKLNKGNDFSTSTCIDVGCGNGNLIKEIKNKIKFKSITGLETNKFAIDYFEQNPEENPFDQLIHASLLDMPLDKKYDFCIFTEVLEHLYDDQVIPALEKLSKISKYIIITTPTPVTCFQLGFSLGELKDFINNNHKLDEDIFNALEGAAHKSTVMRRSMQRAGFKSKIIKWPDNNINKYVRTVVYYGKLEDINLNRINHYGLNSKNYKITKEQDFKKAYLNICLDAALMFPKFNKPFSISKYIKHHINKLIK